MVDFRADARVPLRPDTQTRTGSTLLVRSQGRDEGSWRDVGLA